jgi:hypothetical protein
MKHAIAMLLTLTLTAHGADWKQVCRDWMKTQDTRNARTLYERLITPVSYTQVTETNVVERDPQQVAIEQSLAALLVANAVPISPPFEKGDSFVIDAYLSAKLDAAETAGKQKDINKILKDTSRMMMRWTALESSIYDVDFGKSTTTNITQRTVNGPLLRDVLRLPVTIDARDIEALLGTITTTTTADVDGKATVTP